MRPPEELHAVDRLFIHSEVPDRLRELYAEDAAVADPALKGLFVPLLHQGVVHSDAVVAVPYLAHAAVHARHGRRGLLRFLADTGYDESDGLTADVLPGPLGVSAELPFLLPLLGDADAEVRRQAVRVARWAAGESRPLALAALTECFRADRKSVV